MLAPIVHILPLTTIRRERILPVTGRVVARLDQKVSSLDVVAEADMGREHQLVDVSRLLGILADKADNLILCKPGERLIKNQLIARRPGMFPQSIRSKVDGNVVAVGGGQVLLEVGDTTFELRADMPGKITRIIPEKGVEITISGTLIQGAWGNDHVDYGLMVTTPKFNSPGDVLDADQLDVSLRGAILLAGHCSDPHTLQVAGELPLRGLILGSISPEVIPAAMQAQFPILVTDGIGHHPINSLAYKLLITNVKREVAINGTSGNRHTGARPEIIIPLPVSHEIPMESDLVEFSSGQQVRICRKPNIFEVGILRSILPASTHFPSGVYAAAGEVMLDSGQKLVVPLVNLEVLG